MPTPSSFFFKKWSPIFQEMQKSSLELYFFLLNLGLCSQCLHTLRPKVTKPLLRKIIKKQCKLNSSKLKSIEDFAPQNHREVVLGAKKQQKDNFFNYF